MYKTCGIIKSIGEDGVASPIRFPTKTTRFHNSDFNCNDLRVTLLNKYRRIYCYNTFGGFLYLAIYQLHLGPVKLQYHELNCIMGPKRLWPCILSNMKVKPMNTGTT